MTKDKVRKGQALATACSIFAYAGSIFLEHGGLLDPDDAKKIRAWAEVGAVGAVIPTAVDLIENSDYLERQAQSLLEESPALDSVLAGRIYNQERIKPANNF